MWASWIRAVLPYYLASKVALGAGLLLLAGGAPEAPGAAAAAEPEILPFDRRFDALVPREARPEMVADGFTWLEGPVWRRQEGDLLFSDIPANAVYRWQEGAGATLFLKPSGYTGAAPFAGREPGSNGLALDAQGRLVLCEHGDRRVTRLEADGRRTTLADRYRGRRLNAPNDLTFAPDGSLYFTDPPFGLPGGFEDPARELPWSGVYRRGPEGGLTLLVRELEGPNGIALSPDGGTLYVSDARPDHPVWMSYPLTGDGTVGKGRVLADATPWLAEGPGLPDGLKVDAAGHLFATGPGGVHVLTADGTRLGTIRFGVPTANVAWGEDGSTLFITADHAVWRLRTTTRGAGWPAPR